jgi:hypothetical protein
MRSQNVQPLDVQTLTPQVLSTLKTLAVAIVYTKITGTTGELIDTPLLWAWLAPKRVNFRIVLQLLCPLESVENVPALVSYVFRSAQTFCSPAAEPPCCRPTHDSLRPTLSPLLHSAIVHGVTPKARVKGSEKAPEAPAIKSVLGFHKPDSSATCWTGDTSCSPACTGTS